MAAPFTNSTTMNANKDKYIKQLEDQVFNLTRDCYYLMSLISQNDSDVDWDSWPEGASIKKHLADSKLIEDRIRIARKQQEYEAQRNERIQKIKKEREELQSRIKALDEEETKYSRERHGSCASPNKPSRANYEDPLDGILGTIFGF